jgi:hypothetical protein
MKIKAKDLEKGVKRVAITLNVNEYAMLEALAKSEAIKPTTYICQIAIKEMRKKLLTNQEAKNYLQGFETVDMFDRKKTRSKK